MVPKVTADDVFHQSAVTSDLALKLCNLDLKRTALVFDRVLVMRTKAGRYARVADIPDLVGPDADFLQDRGLLELLDDPFLDLEPHSGYEEIDSTYRPHRRQHDAAISNAVLMSDSQRAEDYFRCADNGAIRSAALKLASEAGPRIVPIVHGADFDNLLRPAGDRHIVDGVNDFRAAILTLKAVPIVDQLTPWEAIIDFRQGRETPGSFARFNRWIRAQVASGDSASDFEEALRIELDNYKRDLRLHRMRYSNRILHTLIVAPAAFVESLLKLQLAKSAEALLSIISMRIDVLEAEDALARRDVHYIVQARETFLKQ